MPRYTVHLIETISTTVEVEADDYEAAIEAAYDSPNMPGGITIGAFGGTCSVDESGEWEVVAVEDATGLEVWRDDRF